MQIIKNAALADSAGTTLFANLQLHHDKANADCCQI
jgi:hypothetical protein